MIQAAAWRVGVDEAIAHATLSCAVLIDVLQAPFYFSMHQHRVLKRIFT